MIEEEPIYSSGWSWEQDKAFENALATVPADAGDRWERIASSVPGKSAEDIKIHYEILVEDLDAIETGQVTLPSYISSGNSRIPASEGGSGSKKGKNSSGHSHGDSNQSEKASRSDQERRKGIAWTEEEHRLFLLGLEKYGKGDWRSISRNFVISRTPTQVASHAQKYFIRLNSMNKDRRRSSIHDITNVSSGSDVSAFQGPITGQASNSPATVSSGKPARPSSSSSSKLPGPPLDGRHGVGIYGGTTIGQPVVGGPLLPAVGTPVNLPVPSPPPYMAYGIRAPIVAAAGAIVPGAPMSFSTMSYPMPRASAHQ